MKWLGGLLESLVNGENDDDKNKKKVLHERGFSKLKASRAKNKLKTMRPLGVPYLTNHTAQDIEICISP